MDWSRAYQIGIVVRDIDEARRHFERAGIGPFVPGPSQRTIRRQIYGKDAPEVVVRGLLAKLGPLELELLQPVHGDGIQHEALETVGEHALHICAHTDSLDRDIREMAERGFDVVSEGWLDDGGRFAYFDTRAVGGLILELFQPGSEYR